MAPARARDELLAISPPPQCGTKFSFFLFRFINLFWVGKGRKRGKKFCFLSVKILFLMILAYEFRDICSRSGTRRVSRAGSEGGTAKALLLVSLTKQVEPSEEEARVSMPAPKAHIGISPGSSLQNKSTYLPRYTISLNSTCSKLAPHNTLCFPGSPHCGGQVWSHPPVSIFACIKFTSWCNTSP